MTDEYRSTAILPPGLWADLKNVTCIGSNGYDGTIESVIAILMAEDLARGKQRVSNSVSEAPKDPNTISMEADTDFDSVKRRRNRPANETAFPIDAKNSTQVELVSQETADKGRALDNDEEARLAKKRAKEASALARLNAAHAYLLTGSNEYRG